MSNALIGSSNKAAPFTDSAEGAASVRVATPNAHFEAIVVGAGFAGMYAVHRLREAGSTGRAVERGHGVGGTWYWNRYPGARVDSPSMQYSLSFSSQMQQEWQWSE